MEAAVEGTDLAQRARMLDLLGQAVICTDPAGVVTYWNARAETLYGWTAEEAVGRPVSELTVAPVEQAAAAEVMQALMRGEPWTGAFTVRRKDGSTFTALVTDTALVDDAGEVTGILGVSSDLGQTLRPYLAHSQEAAIVTSREGIIYYASPSVQTVLGWHESALVARALLDYVHPEDRLLMHESIVSAAAGSPKAAEFRVRRGDESYLWVEARWMNMLGERSVGGLVCTLVDIEERRAALDRLKDLALTDALTGIANRSEMAARLEHAVARRDQRGALLFLDLDGFKAVNDNYGHAVGDRLLQEVAQRLQHAIRPEDTCGRWAGDEFLVLAETVAEPAEAAALVERVAAVIEQPLEIDGTVFRPQVSVGVALLAQAHSCEQALAVADQDMYRVKRRRSAVSERRRSIR